MIIIGLRKKVLYKIIQYFPKPYELFKGDIIVKADMCNYATKADLKSETGIDTSGFTLKSNIGSLKDEVDKIDVEKFENAQTNYAI